MIRMSMLRNCPVICEDRQIGLLQSISFDPAQKAVHALIVSGGLKGKRVIPACSILAMTHEFILVGQHEKYSRSCEKTPFRFARDAAGMLVGRVVDYLIDEESLRVLSLEVMRGYLPSECRIRIWAYAYRTSSRRADEAIVPFSFSLMPSDQREEACMCESQP